MTDSNNPADALVNRGINRITANHLADEFEDVAAVRDAVSSAADLTDLRGVGDASAVEVADAFGRDGPLTVEGDPGERPGPNGETGHLGTTKDPENSESAESAESAAQSDRGQSDSANPSDSTESSENSESATTTASAATDGGAGLPWRARKYLSGSWGRYKKMLREYREAREETNEYLDLRAEGAEAAAEINEIRREHGQEPIDFHAADDDIAAEGVSGTLLPDDVESKFSWTFYDPTDDL